jgi:hypothetical protein
LAVSFICFATNHAATRVYGIETRPPLAFMFGGLAFPILRASLDCFEARNFGVLPLPCKSSCDNPCLSVRERLAMYQGLVRQLVIALPALLLVGAVSRADLEFHETTVDAGEVRAGAPLSHRFTFVNQGPDVVEITGVESSCGCLTPQLDQRILPPGAHGSISLEVNTLSPAPGPHTWQVKLSCRVVSDVVDTTHHSLLTTYELRLAAWLIREIVVEPASITVFADSPLQIEIRLTDLRSEPLHILELHTTSPALQARLAGEEHDATGHLVRKVQLTVGADLTGGRHEEILSLFTNDAAYPEIKIPVTVVKRSKQRLSATPSRIELTLRPGAGPPARIVLIRDQENQQVEVETATADNPAITCRWAKGPGAMTTLRVQVDPAQILDPTWQSTVRVQILKPTRQTLLIPVTITAFTP